MAGSGLTLASRERDAALPTSVIMRLKASSLALSAALGCALEAPVHAAPFLSIGETAEIFLTAGAGARYDTNVFLSATDIDDVVLTFSPGLEIIFGKGSLSSGRFYLSEEFSYYFDLTQLNDELLSTGLTYRYDDLKLRFAFDGSFRQVNEATRDVLFQVVEIIDLIKRDVTRLSTSGELRMTAKFKGSAAARYDATDYKLDAFTDYQAISVPLNIYYEYTEKVDLSVGLSFRDTSLSGAGIDSTDLYYNLGARGEFTPKLSGDFSVGYRTREFDRARTVGGSTTDDSVGFDAGFSYEITPKLTSDLTLSKDFGTGPGGESLDDLSISLGADAQISPEWTAGVTVTYRDTTFNTVRQDDFYVFQLNGSYAYSEHLRFTGYYVLSDNNSTARRLTFTNHTLGFVANLRY